MAEPVPDKKTAHQVAPEDRVPVVQKVAYGLGTFNDMWGNWLYPGIIWPVFQIFLGVPPWLVSTALFLNRLFDAFSDPFFGWLSDNTRSRWGRRRPYILVGGLLAGFFLPGLVWVTPGWGVAEWFGFEIPNYFWYMVVSSAAYITIVSCFNVPFQSLGAELTPDVRERTSVFSFKTGIQKVAELAMFAASAFCTATVWSGATADNVFDRLALMFRRTTGWFGDFFGNLFTFDLATLSNLLANPFGWNTPTEGGPVNTLLGAQVYTIMLGSIMMTVGVVMFLVLRERYYHKVVARKQERIDISETIWKVLKCRPFRANLSMGFAYAMGTAMVGTLGYYATVYYVCAGNVTVGSIWNFWMGLSNTILGFFGVPIFAFIANRFGKKAAMMWVQVSAMLVFAGTWWFYNPDIRWMQLFASGLIALTGAGFWLLYGSIGADIIDYDELEHGKRREGAFTACGQWVMKLGQAVGIGCSGVVLSATGFDSSLGNDQLPDAIFNIRLYLAVIPIVGLGIALAILSRFPLTQDRVLEIRKELETRRGIV